MASGGILVRPEDRREGAEGGSGKAKLWDQTWRRLERLLPDLKGELFPAVTVENPAAAEVEASPVTETKETEAEAGAGAEAEVKAEAEAEEKVSPQEVADGTPQTQPAAKAAANVADID